MRPPTNQDAHERIGLQEAARQAVDAGSFVADVVDLVRASPGNWEVSSAPENAPVWIYVDPPDPPHVASGWKLHVSSAVPSAEEVLRRCAPVLLSDNAPFKLAASFRVLEALNEGEAGLSQIGKFITVYPGDDDHAVALASRLHEATQGLRGPRVLSDRPLTTGSLVHYRYGAFDAPELKDDGSALVEDPLAARSSYAAPESVDDPFLAKGIAEPDDKSLVAGRYYLSSTIHRSARGAVHTAVDMEGLRNCIVKRAWRDARLGPDGLDARDQLRVEAAVLRQLEGKGPFPGVYDVVSHETDLLLVMEQIPGAPLGAVVHRMFDKGNPPALDEIVGWARSLARALGAVHDEGLVYRDLNPANAIATREGKVSLIDFELTRRAGSTTDFYTAGTPGFLSPQQAQNEPASAADDVFSLGAIIVFAATGDRPSGRGDATRVGDRFGRSGHALERVAERCLAHDPDQRFSDVRALDVALASAAS